MLYIRRKQQRDPYEQLDRDTLDGLRRRWDRDIDNNVMIIFQQGTFQVTLGLL
jgi:hypothetical protein